MEAGETPAMEAGETPAMEAGETPAMEAGEHPPPWRVSSTQVFVFVSQINNNGFRSME